MDLNPEIVPLINEIKSDRTHGASELARQAAKVLKISSERSQGVNPEQLVNELKDIARNLEQARPAMAPISNMTSALLGAVTSQATSMTLPKLKLFAASRAEEMINSSSVSVIRIAERATELIASGDRIITHSYSSTVVAALKKAFDRWGTISVITTRSSPGGSGQITAAKLHDYGIPVTFIDDAAMASYIQKADIAVIGADRICADGQVVNGVGSYQLALAAARNKVPLYVLGELLKFDPRQRGDQVDLEKGEPDELVTPARLPTGITHNNSLFDITPPDLVTGVLTEKGLFTRKQLTSYLSDLVTPDTPGIGSP
jgi:eIF-2B alpha/beta/delta-like uncharacterized protein